METKKTFLSDPEWMTIPWNKSERTAFDRLVDIILKAPAQMERADQLHFLPQGVHLTFCVDLLLACYSLDDDFAQFYAEYESAATEPLFYQVLTAEDQSAESEQDWSTIQLSFPDVSTAATMILYWATSTILWSGMCHLHKYIGQLTALTLTDDGFITGKFTEDDPIGFVFPQPTRCFGFLDSCRKVLQAVDFSIQDEASTSSMVAPLTMVIETLAPRNGVDGQNYDQELGMANQKLDLIASKGMRIIKYIREMFPSKPKPR